MAKTDSKDLRTKIGRALEAAKQAQEAQRKADLALFEAFEALRASENLQAYQAYLKYKFFKFETTDRIRAVSYEAILELLKFVETMAEGVNFQNSDSGSILPPPK